jgi:hypothetical protein
VRSISGRAWSTKVPETGAVREIRGGVVSRRRVTCATACPAFPAVSVATAVIVLAPSTRVTVAVKALPDSAAGWPLTVTLAIPPASVAVPVTWSETLVTVCPSVGLEMATAGGVVSPFWRVAWTVACPSFPAASVAATVIVLAPAVRGTEAVKAPPESGTTWPLTVTLAMALASVTVPMTWMGDRMPHVAGMVGEGEVDRVRPLGQPRGRGEGEAGGGDRRLRRAVRAVEEEAEGRELHAGEIVRPGRLDRRRRRGEEGVARRLEHLDRRRDPVEAQEAELAPLTQ